MIHTHLSEDYNLVDHCRRVFQCGNIEGPISNGRNDACDELVKRDMITRLPRFNHTMWTVRLSLEKSPEREELYSSYGQVDVDTFSYNAANCVGMLAEMYQKAT